jgi:hypothetical protein
MPAKDPHDTSSRYGRWHVQCPDVVHHQGPVPNPRSSGEDYASASVRRRQRNPFWWSSRSSPGPIPLRARRWTSRPSGITPSLYRLVGAPTGVGITVPVALSEAWRSWRGSTRPRSARRRCSRLQARWARYRTVTGAIWGAHRPMKKESRNASNRWGHITYREGDSNPHTLRRPILSRIGAGFRRVNKRKRIAQPRHFQQPGEKLRSGS